MPTNTFSLTHLTTWWQHVDNVAHLMAVLHDNPDLSVPECLHVLDFLGAKNDGGGGDNCSYKTCKTHVTPTPPTNQYPAFYRSDAILVGQLCQSIEETMSHYTDLVIKLTWGGCPTLSLAIKSSWLPWGRLSSLSSALWHQNDNDDDDASSILNQNSTAIIHVVQQRRTLEESLWCRTKSNPAISTNSRTSRPMLVFIINTATNPCDLSFNTHIFQAENAAKLIYTNISIFISTNQKSVH